MLYKACLLPKGDYPTKNEMIAVNIVEVME